MTLSMGGFDAFEWENAALLSPCHTQISRPRCSFLRHVAAAGTSNARFDCGWSLITFLLCS
jgi:hypothetical protein